MTVKPLSPEALARSVARLRIALNDLSPNSWEGGTSTETLVTRWVLAEVLDELEKYRAVVEAAREALIALTALNGAVWANYPDWAFAVAETLGATEAIVATTVALDALDKTP